MRLRIHFTSEFRHTGQKKRIGIPTPRVQVSHHGSVGAAMEFALGLKKRASRFVKTPGLEWLARLASDTVTLQGRYLVPDIRFFTFCGALGVTRCATIATQHGNLTTGCRLAGF